MAATPAQKVESGATVIAGSSVTALWTRTVERVPRKARLPVALGFLVLVSLIVYGAWSGSASTLQIVCRHGFRAADLSVRVDGDLAFSEHLSGASRKRFGVFGQVEGNFSRSVPLSSGEHLVEVQLKSTEDGFNQTKSSRINLPRGEATTLQVSTSRDAMSLSYQGPAVSSAGWAHWSDGVMSILAMLGGTIASAGVGFFVQEFLKSKKPA